MSNKNVAEVVISSSTKPPTLTAGTITPEALRTFENACKNYLRNKENLNAADHVARVAGGFLDPLISDWYWLSQERFDSIMFKDFMTEVRAKWLQKDWELDVRRRLLGTKQSGSFWDWSIVQRNLNSLLINTPHYLTDEQLHNTLEANLDPDLLIAYNDAKVTETKLDDWLSKVKTIDDKTRREQDVLKRLALEAARGEAARGDAARGTKRNGQAAGISEPSRNYNRPNNNNTSSTSSSAFVKLPRLTDAEKNLLDENQGCRKCRRFFVSHHSTNCPNDYPSAAKYKPLTAEDVSQAHPRGKPVASVGPAEPIVALSAPIAAIMPPPNALSVLHGDEGDLSKDSNDSVSTTLAVPFSLPHLHWTCALDDPTSVDRLVLTGLIDNGSHAVLIRPDLVERLALRIRKLPSPMEVDVAISASTNKRCPTTFTHWVKLKAHDTQNFWSSRTVRAVIAPGLCAPIIFGLPFLSVNNIVIDHNARTCIDKNNTFDLLNPSLPTSKKPTVPAQQHNRETLKYAKLAKDVVIAELKLLVLFKFPVSRFQFPVSRFPFPVSRFPFSVFCFPFSA